MPITDPDERPRAQDLPDNIKEAFRGKALLSLPTVAKLLGMDQETLSGHLKRHRLPYRQYGTGKKRPRKVFGIDEVAAIWHSLMCQLSH